MATIKRRIVRRGGAAKEPVVVEEKEEPEAEAEELADEEADAEELDDADEEAESEEEDVEEPEPVKPVRRIVKPTAKPAVVKAATELADSFKKIGSRVIPKAAVPAKVAPKAAEKPAEDERVGDVGSASLFDSLSELLESGVTLSMRKVGTKIVLYKSAPLDQLVGKKAALAVGARRMTKAAMESIALTDDYKEWTAGWKGLSFEDKVKEAKKNKVTWDEIDDPLANNLRLSMAYTAALGIEKWKPEYKSRVARQQLLLGGVPDEAGIEPDAAESESE